jgi:NAD(P)-dependent dehydrogenase (short-subunit alcohol dehydrogenase family)
MSGRVEGRVVLVTGGASGIGRATAGVLAAEGARVVLADLDGETGEAAAAAIRETGGQARFIRVDVTDSHSVDALVSETVHAYGRLDCAHNNAGVLGPVGDMLDCSYEDYERVTEGAHSIVNTASVAGLVGSPSVPAYSASKHAVVGLTRSAARAYGGRGIRINCVCPGPIETPLAEDLLAQPGARERYVERQAVPRLGLPEEIAAMVAWLCSADASMVTGVPVRVDGGALA